MEEKTLPELTKEQELAIYERVREKRLKMSIEAQAAAPKKPRIRRLYLITYTYPGLALPDNEGTAVHSMTTYGWIERREDQDEGEAMYFGGMVEVVARGDGRKFKEPIHVLLVGGHVLGLAQVNEVLLRD